MFLQSVSVIGISSDLWQACLILLIFLPYATVFLIQKQTGIPSRLLVTFVEKNTQNFYKPDAGPPS